MSYNPTLPPGQAAMSSSSPVVLASDQTTLPSNITSTIAGEDINNDVLKVEHRYSYYPISTLGTFQIASQGALLAVIDFTAVATGVITIYDNITATGTPVRTITSPATILQNEVNKIYNIALGTGLTIVTSVAAQNIVVTYRVNS